MNLHDFFHLLLIFFLIVRSIVYIKISQKLGVRNIGYITVLPGLMILHRSCILKERLVSIIYVEMLGIKII